MRTQQLLLGVNIDHVATLRQARRTAYPDPLAAALRAERAGADSITVHLREDRRHIQQRDVELLRAALQVPLNLEMAVSEAMLALAERVRPAYCCLVPERREELTTEGGLDVAGQAQKIGAACARLAAAGIRAALFIDPDADQLRAAMDCGAPAVELHTGAYAMAADAGEHERAAHELEQLRAGAKSAAAGGLLVHAGHGLNYDNVAPVAQLPELRELNIGHSIVARAVFDGLDAAVREMRRLLAEARA